MSTIMKINPQGQIRIPKKLMEKLGVEESDYVEVVLKEGNIVLKPRKLIDPSQGWYWAKEWQIKEVEAGDQIKKGKLSPKFKTANEGIKWLIKS